MPDHPPLRLLFVAEGNAETNDCWSGLAVSLIRALRAAGHEVRVVDVELKGLPRLVGAAMSLRTNRERWRQAFILGMGTFHLRSAMARRAVRATGYAPDVLIQLGASFDLGTMPVPMHVLLADGNAAMARAAGEFSDISTLSDAIRQRIVERERRIYARVDRLWATSDYLARSFQSDFGVPQGKTHVVYAGANRRELESLPPRTTAPSSRRILFVGKQYRRKGLDVLVSAFARVRGRFPDAELHIVGTPRDAATGAGVVLHGRLSPEVPEEARRLLDLYGSASLFCLPSRYEPFGVSFAEAMMASLPCIGASAWAMPEIIEDHVTGRLVPPNDADALAAAIEAVLEDPSLATRMGLAGRERAHARFTWDRVVSAMVADARATPARRIGG